ncbi:MAG TPA: class II fumarate hydratase, partial [Methanobacterium sp.]
IATAKAIKQGLIPSLTYLRNSLQAKSEEWADIIKVGRTHMQDATPLTLGQEFSGYAGLLDDNLERINNNLGEIYHLTLGGTAVGTGMNTPHGFDRKVAEEIAKLTELPFKTATNKFKAQGSHDALVMLSGTLKTLATSLYKIANDIRILSCGPRCGFHELEIPANEPGSSVMPGKINPTQCEALAMVAVQVMANDVAVTFGGGGGYLEMNVYKPLIIRNIMHSVNIITDGCHKFRKYLVEGIEPDKKQINYFLDRSLMQITALSPVIGYDKAAKAVKHAMDNDLTLKKAVLDLKYISEDEYDNLVDPAKMIHPRGLNSKK